MIDVHEDSTHVLLPLASTEPIMSIAARLLVIEGPDEGKEITIRDLAHRRVLIGKGPACEVLLTDRSVSRRHASIELEGARIRVTDLGSSNGTHVGTVRVRDALAQHGDILRLGATAIRVVLEDDAHEVPASPDSHFGKLVGTSPEMRRVYPVLARLAASKVPVLIEGETGTGKEVVAESLHDASPRASGPFIVFDCTTVAASLFEAELFGHERGAFTGAVAARPGVFEQAHGGTLFIDEIGDLDLPLQAKLLRALERSEVRRVGGTQWTKVDVRIVAATRRDLDAEVQARRFRDDLFYRLAVARVELPPLRKRAGDVRLLATWFWRELGGEGPLPMEALQRFEGHDWPGNVRELQNAVARQIALGDVRLGRSLAESTAPPAPEGDFIDELIARGLPFSRGRQEATAEYDRRYVKHMLDAHGGDSAAAAEASGIGRRYFQKLKTKL